MNSESIEDLKLTQKTSNKLRQANIFTTSKLKEIISQGKLSSILNSSGITEIIQKLQL